MRRSRIFDAALAIGVLSVILAASWLEPIIDGGSGLSLVTIWFALVAVGMFALLRVLGRIHEKWVWGERTASE